MSALATLPGRRLQVLFLLALLGVLLAVGLLAAVLGGWPVAVGYAVVVSVALVCGARRARLAARPAPSGRTCTCCTTSVHDPVVVR